MLPRSLLKFSRSLLKFSASAAKPRHISFRVRPTKKPGGAKNWGLEPTFRWRMPGGEVLDSESRLQGPEETDSRLRHPEEETTALMLAACDWSVMGLNTEVEEETHRSVSPGGERAGLKHEFELH